jgi:hypothetical protein
VATRVQVSLHRGSCKNTSDAFRKDLFLSTHKHGPRCIEIVREVIFPLSFQAHAYCKAEIRETGPSQVVSLRLCEKSTYFSIETPLTANVTLLGLETEVNGPAEWEHPIEARIHLDPDGDEAELFNASYTDNIVASIGDQGWALDVRYFFGLNLHLVLPHVFTAFLGGDNELPSLVQIHRTVGVLQHIRLSHAEAWPIARVSTPVEDET